MSDNYINQHRADWVKATEIFRKSVARAVSLFKANGMEVPVSTDMPLSHLKDDTIEVGWVPHNGGKFVVWVSKDEAIPFEFYADRVTAPELEVMAKAIPILWEEAADARDKGIEVLATQAEGIASFVNAKMGG